MDDGIVIDIDDEYDGDGKPAAGSGAKARADAAEAKEREARAEAQRARAEAAAAKAAVIEAEKWRLASHVDRIDAQTASAEQDLYVAAERGDFAGQTAAHQKIGKLAAERGQYEAAHRQIANARPTAPVGDPVEAFISTRTPQTQQWLRDHPDDARALAYHVAGQASGDDARRARKLSAAHEDALAEGYSPDTPQYFKHVERHIGASGKKGNAMSGSGGGRQVEVSLSTGEVEAATDGITHVWQQHDVRAGRCKPHQVGSGIGVKEMARRKHQMQKQGLYR